MEKGKRGREEKMGKKKRKKKKKREKKPHLKIFSVFSQDTLQVFVYLSKP